MAITAVAFDLMDTLVHDPWREGLLAAFGDQFEAATEARDPTAWPRFESGQITEDEFWSTFAEFDPDPEACRRVRRARTHWLPGMRDLVADVHRAGAAVALASNYPTWITDLRPLLADAPFDAQVVSCEVGVRKPQPAFFAAVADAVARTPGEVAFLDDREGNVQAAADFGMQSRRFADSEDTRRWLAGLGVLGPAS